MKININFEPKEGGFAIYSEEGKLLAEGWKKPAGLNCTEPLVDSVLSLVYEMTQTGVRMASLEVETPFLGGAVQ